MNKHCWWFNSYPERETIRYDRWISLDGDGIKISGWFRLLLLFQVIKKQFLLEDYEFNESR